MIFNRKKLTTCNINSKFNEKRNIKLHMMIFNALSVCINLREIILCLWYQRYNGSMYPKSFYNFFIKFFLLERIEFHDMSFFHYMNFTPFQSLQFLQSLSFSFCLFHINCFEEHYINNFPNLNRLDMMHNEIKNWLTDQNESKSLPILKSMMKFPSILEIIIRNKSNYLEKLIFQKLILCQKISMKFLYLHFWGKFNLEEILCSIKFLKSSKIKLLSLIDLGGTEGFDSPDFLQFLRNSDSLLGLRLCNSNKDFKLNLIPEELSLNQNLQILYLDTMNLLDFSSNLVNLIYSNKTISTLILVNDKWKIDKAFIDAVLKRQTLLYLILYNVQIKDYDLLLNFTELNLKGINVDGLFLGDSITILIYKRIPRIEYQKDDDLLHYEQFLRPIN